ncbi:MAG: APC family permease [Actinomycetota bacterium]
MAIRHPQQGSEAAARGRPRTLPNSAGYGLKRLLLGPAIPTANLVHERLGKPTALAVFASDNLSSVAYATEEILKVAVLAGIGVAAFTIVMPITIGILAVLGILLFSYRQTIRAYPSAGGAYIVTKDNFGLLPAQIAGVALLTDYVLTVSVSIAAGIAAVTSAAPGLYPYRVWMSVFCIWFIAWGNLRGVRESGRMFAVPTYFFIFMMFLMLGVGLFREFTSGLHPLPIPAHVARLTGAVTFFLILKAFASGGAAVTGVEAVSNGVPAFKPVEWKNARTTLMWMGSLLGMMFLGLSFLTVRLQVLPTETKTVISQVARAIFGGGGLGYGLFLALQAATTLILILAANTSFADFPRLANFHATDNFMPRQLTMRGHRLVFSNGIIGLAAASTVLVVLFKADVSKLIPFYAIGVFTSFTLSQAGMSRRHLRLREPGWRVGLMINGLGAITTAVVTVVIGVSKFVHGAWAVMVFVPVMVWLLVRLNHQYEREHKDLEENLERMNVERLERPITVLLVDDVDAKTIHALGYAKTIRADDLTAVHIEEDPLGTLEVETAWQAAGLSEIPLKILRGSGEEASRLAGFIGGLPKDRDVNLLMPVPHDVSRRERLSEARAGARLARACLPYDHVRVTLVRDHPDGVHPLQHDAQGRPVVRLVPRGTHFVVVLIDKLDRATLRSVRYALTLGAAEVWAVHAAVDPERAAVLAERWMDHPMPVPLDVIECWDRNVSRSLEQHVLGLAERGTEVTVVMARRDYPTFRQRMLHDRTSNKIMKALGRYPHIDVSRVPYYFAPGGKDRKTDKPVAAPVDVQ